MFARNKFNLLSTAALSVCAIALTVAPANALPGQNINTVLNWAKTRPQLSALKYNSEAHGYEGRNGNLYFYVNTTSQNGTVTKEGITVSDDPSIKFTTNNAKGMKLLQNIYNSEIANDFRNSRSVAKVGRDNFLRGQKFAYITAAVQGGTNLQIISLNNLQSEINNAKHCQTHQCDL
jgi:hypothetical protein